MSFCPPQRMGLHILELQRWYFCDNSIPQQTNRVIAIQNCHHLVWFFQLFADRGRKLSQHRKVLYQYWRRLARQFYSSKERKTLLSLSNTIWVSSGRYCTKSGNKRKYLTVGKRSKCFPSEFVSCTSVQFQPGVLPATMADNFKSMSQ